MGVLDADGDPIPGYTAADAVPVAGDQLAAEIKWKGKPGCRNWPTSTCGCASTSSMPTLYSYWVS